MTSLETHGYEIIEGIYSSEEVDAILAAISITGVDNKFGVREFLSDHPDVANLIFNERLRDIVKSVEPTCSKAIKSIYFDKPPNANWVVNWHQDLTLNLTGKTETEGFTNWRVMKERTVVQPPRRVLENIFTIRVHLDDCTKANGALRVMEGSHRNGVIPISAWSKEKEGTERICEVGRGGVLLMRPLILHASKRTENEARRRVIHVEFTGEVLPEGMEWKEAVRF